MSHRRPQAFCLSLAELFPIICLSLAAVVVVKVSAALATVAAVVQADTETL